MNRQFAMGAATALGVVMMIQDWYGLEGYIQHVRDHWIDLPWWVGGGIAALSSWLGRDKTPNVQGQGEDTSAACGRSPAPYGWGSPYWRD